MRHVLRAFLFLCRRRLAGACGGVTRMARTHVGRHELRENGYAVLARAHFWIFAQRKLNSGLNPFCALKSEVDCVFISGK